MISPILFLDIAFAIVAIAAGLGSRNFATSIVAGIFIGLCHAGLVALVGAQSGKYEIAECPYLKDAVDYAMNTGVVTFSNARYVVYLAAAAVALILATIVAYLVRWILCRIICAIMPKRTPAAQETPTS
jgi:hypothetical protein